MMFAATTMMIGLFVVAPSSRQSDLSVTDVVASLRSLGERGPVAAEWTSSYHRGVIPADWAQAELVRSVRLQSTGEHLVCQVSESGRTRQVGWANQVTVNRSDSHVSLSSDEPRIPGRETWVWDMLVDSLFENPGGTPLLLRSLLAGQVLTTNATESGIIITGYAFDEDIDRFTLEMDASSGSLRIASIRFEQAVTPADRPFEERVLLTHDMRVLRYEMVGGIDTPVEAIFETRANADAIEDPDVNKFWRDRPPAYGHWLLGKIEAIDDPDAVAANVAGIMPGNGDIVTDERLGLVYKIGENRVAYNGVSYKLDQPIEGVLDKSILGKLEGLEIETVSIPSEDELGRGEARFYDSPWVLAVGGIVLLIAGACGLLWRRSPA